MLQGRHDTFPKRRGLTRVKEMQAIGIRVGWGQDCVLDPWYSLGTADMTQPVAQNSTIRNVLLAGILLMLAGDFLFALNDAMGKWLVASFSVGQVVLIRSIGAFFVLGPMIAHQGAAKLFRMTSTEAVGINSLLDCSPSVPSR